MQHYHYVFTGSGLSALMTVYEIIMSANFQDKSILLIDENSKKSNDRTWCFWDKSNIFNEIISKKWKTTFFTNDIFIKELEIQPFQYKMIRGLDFYNFIFEKISKHTNITFLNEKVLSFEDLGNQCVIKTNQQEFTANIVFNSIFNPKIVISQNKYPLLQQHFIGWYIKSKEPVFNSNCATFMDFSVAQKGNTRFMYVLPTSKTEALLEYTLFSKDLLPKEEYEEELVKYIQKLGITEYEIVEKEQGSIPMTCYKFWEHNTKNSINIGSAGGWTKASTGFTFKNVTKKSKALVTFLQNENDLTKFHKKDKFWIYDLLFIDVLFKNNALGSKVFSSLFKKGNPVLIFRFLDEETSFLEDLKIIWKCPKIPFINALLNRIL
ncbi:lycopene cyclase family protein [Flavobacterium sp. HNIBRBA15423]|uniref:lycopene cyclase family protein n=1 Tax=Flavobacterium sp. HNIBRBA15423 TaxID=3458683 RepID=UPI004044F929